MITFLISSITILLVDKIICSRFTKARWFSLHAIFNFINIFSRGKGLNVEHSCEGHGLVLFQFNAKDIIGDIGSLRSDLIIEASAVNHLDVFLKRFNQPITGMVFMGQFFQMKMLFVSLRNHSQINNGSVNI